MKALINIKIYDYINYIEDGFILFNKEIVEVGKMSEFSFNGETIDGHGKIVIPGLINFHTHIYSTLIRGFNINANPVTFQDILDQIWWKFDSYLTLEDLFASAYLYGIESIKSGVTSMIDHNASSDILGSLSSIRKALNDLNIKSLLCFETSDRFNINDCIDENINEIEHGYFGMHASLSLSDNTLGILKDITNNYPIHIHVAESSEDQENSLKKYNKRVVQRLDDYNLLKENSILAHCVHINDEEAKLIAKNNCKIALNPTSNLNNAVGFFNYKLFRDNNIQLLIGTDGLGVNIAREWQNLFYVGKNSLNEPNGISLDQIKDYIKSSYEYFNDMAKVKTGQLSKGYSSDFLLIDYNSPTPITNDNIFAHIFYGIFENLKPHSVIINGQFMINNYETTFKQKNYHNVVKKLWKRIEE